MLLSIEQPIRVIDRLDRVHLRCVGCADGAFLSSGSSDYGKPCRRYRSPNGTSQNQIRVGLIRLFFGARGGCVISNSANNRKKRERQTISGHRPSASARRDRGAATCEEEVAFLDRYLSSGLTDWERDRFERHLAACGDCVAFLRTYKTTIELTRSFLSHQEQPGRLSELSLKRRSRRTNRR